MHGECVSVFPGPPLWCSKRPCVWSEWFPSSRSEQISETLQTAVSHTASDERRAKKERSNKQGLFDPAAAQQPAKFPLSQRGHRSRHTDSRLPTALSCCEGHHSHAAVPVQPERAGDKDVACKLRETKRQIKQSSCAFSSLYNQMLMSVSLFVFSVLQTVA